MNIVHIIQTGMIYRVLKSLLTENISSTRIECSLKFPKVSILWLKIGSMHFSQVECRERRESILQLAFTNVLSTLDIKLSLRLQINFKSEH